MKVVVSGASGFIGRHTTSRLCDAGHQVVALYNRHRPSTTGSIHWVKCDLTQAQCGLSEADVDGVEGLIHLAAGGVNPREGGWASLFELNVSCAIRLWLFAIKSGVQRIINCGSCFEYGAAANRHDFVPASAAPEPLNAYAASKAAATMALHAMTAAHGIRAITLRPCVVYGDGEPDYRLWPSLRRAAFAGEDFPMTAAQQVRDFMPVESLATQLCLALERPDLLPGRMLVENVGSGNPQSVLEFASFWWNHWGGSGRLLPGRVPTRESECLRMVPEVARISDENLSMPST